MSTKNAVNIKAKDNFEYSFLCFDENVFIKFKALNNFQRDKAQNIFKECLSHIESTPELKKILKTLDVDFCSEKLLSNLIISSSCKGYVDSVSLKNGIALSILALMKNRKRELNSLRDILFFNKEISNLTNKKLFDLYKKTLVNKSIAMSLLDKKDYDRVYNENLIYDIKRRDILNEFSKRSKISKVCDLVNVNNVVQDKGYFIPKKEEDDIIIVLFKNEPYRLLDIKRKLLFTKKVDGKIFWQ